MSISFSEKIKVMRNSFGMSQDKFSKFTGISLSSIKRVETGGDMSFASLQKLTTHEHCSKYTLWLVSDTTNAIAGQIAPGDELPEQAAEKEQLAQAEYEEKFVKTVGDSILMFCHLDWFTPKSDSGKLFDDCGKIILKDLRPVIESRYKETKNSNEIKSA